MTKPFKLKLSLSSFQLCRSKVSCILTPENPKGVNITYPRSSPAPPPSSPNHPSGKRNVTSKTKPIGFESVESSLCTSVDSQDVQAYLRNSTVQKLHNSPEASMEFDECVLPIPSTNAEKNNNKEGNVLKKNPSAISITMSVSSADSGWFSSEDVDVYDDDSEGSVSSCSSLDDSYEFGHSENAPNDHKSRNGNGSRRNKKDGKVRRLKRYVSNNGKDGEKTTTAPLTLPDSEVLGGLHPCVVDGKVNESYAVMKKSTDPFDDFKTSMLEMIEEKQISEPEELEKLLLCFLSLNARDHHAVIVAAFTEVWEELHSSSNSQN